MAAKIMRKPVGTGGTYVYDKTLGKVVRISDRIPKVASKHRASLPNTGPCGRNACGGGRCAKPS